MKTFSPIVTSIALHAGLASAAWQLPQYFDLPKKEDKPRQVYTLDFIPAPKNSVLYKKPLPKKRIAKSKVTSKKAAKKKVRLTQKQKSPVKIVQSKPQQVSKQKPSIAVSKPSAPRDGRLLQQQDGNLPPQYPLIDRIRKNTGRVSVLGFVNNNGKVSQVRVDESSGTKRMNSNAIQAFSNYKFQKGQQGWVKMPFEYVLSGQTKVISTRDRHKFENLRSL